MKRRDPVQWWLLVLVLAHAGGLFAFAHLPTQDGASHAYNAHVLLHLDEAPYATLYESAWTPVPNWLGGALMVGLGSLFGVALAEKLLVALGLIVFCAGVRRLCDDGETTSPVALVAPTLFCGYPLYMGFYSFSLGLAVVPWAWDAARRDRPTRVLALSAIAWLAHLVAVLAVLAGAVGAIVGRARRQRVRMLLAATPATALSAIWLAGRPGGGAVRLPADTLLENLLTLRTAAPWPGTSEWIAIAIAATLLALLAWRLKAARPAPDGWTLIALLLLYLALPDGGAGHWFLSERLSLLAWLSVLALAAGAPVRTGRGRTVTAAVLTGLSLSAWAVDLGESRRIEAEVAEVEALAERIAPGSGIVLLDFGDARAARVRPILHSAGWIATERNIVDLANYEAQTDHFQTRLKNGVVMPDHQALLADPAALDVARFGSRIHYILIRGMASPVIIAKLEGRYAQVASAGGVRLLERLDNPLEE